MGLMEEGDPRAEISDRLRGRILRGLRAGTVRSGDRLPSSRELAPEFGVDHRIVLDAYRALDAEGIVEMRPRGGVYVGGAGVGALAAPSPGWMAEVFVQAINRELGLSELHEWLRRAVETVRLRALVVQSTVDQVAGLCRELREYYGIEATGVDAARLEEKETAAGIRSAHLIVTTPAFEAAVRPLAERSGKRLVVVDVRPDLIGGEWRLLLEQPVYLVAADDRFLDLVRRYFAQTPGAENIRELLVGRDSLEDIPADAAVYLTAGARERLGDRSVPGRILPSGRFLSTASARAVARYVAEANLRAFAALDELGSE